MSDLGNKEVFADNLKRYMDEYGLERPDIARIVEKSYSTVNDWYNGKTYPRIDAIEALANYFRISKSDLIERQPKTMSPTRAYLTDKIAKADEEKLEKFKKLLELIDDEEINHR